MKKKMTILFVQLSLVWMGISVVMNTVSATKKDGERALELLRQARAAIGGDVAVKNVQSLSMKAKTHRVFKVKNQADKEIVGDIEMGVILPDQIFRLEKFDIDGNANGTVKFEAESGQLDKNMVFELHTDKGEWTEDNAKAARAVSSDNEMFRFMLGFLLTPPKDANLTYDYTGEENIDGQSANVIAVSSNGNSVVRLYLDKQTNLPLMMSYKGFSPHLSHVGEAEWLNGEKGKINVDGKNVIIVREPNGDVSKQLPDKVKIERKIDGSNMEGKTFNLVIGKPADADIQVRFSDYRYVGGIRLPFQLTEIINGTVDNTTTVESYEINPPNIAEKFQRGNVKIRVRQPQ